jgi:hypothetical protein
MTGYPREMEELSELRNLLRKDFADVFESWVAAVTLDAGDLNLSQLVTAKLLNPEYIDFIPNFENNRKRVEALINAKKYTKGLKVTH